MKILIDNGHGSDTKGKRSPKMDDGTRLFEYAYARKVAKEAVERLKAKGYDATLLTPEENDIPISTRCRRANIYCKNYGAKNVLLVSVHLDAMGADDQWHSARGWSARVSLNASDRSKQLASCLAKSAEAEGIKVKRYLPSQDWWAQNLGICRDSNCPAVLTENLFQDNKEDVQYLMSKSGFDNIVNLHVEGIAKYIHSILT